MPNTGDLHRLSCQEDVCELHMMSFKATQVIQKTEDTYNTSWYLDILALQSCVASPLQDSTYTVMIVYSVTQGAFCARTLSYKPAKHMRRQVLQLQTSSAHAWTS